VHGEGTERPLDLFFIGVLFFQRRTDYNQTHYPINMVNNLEDALKGNNNTKIVHLLDLLKKKLDRIESKIDAIEEFQFACIGDKE
jgi:hypothetical protein